MTVTIKSFHENLRKLYNTDTEERQLNDFPIPIRFFEKL